MGPAGVDAVRTSEDLATFVLALREDLLATPGYSVNRGVEPPGQPDWNLAARMLMAASVYE